VAAVNDHLNRIFDTLVEYGILAGGESTVDPEGAEAIEPALFDPSDNDLERVRQVAITALEDVSALVGESEADIDGEMVADGESSSADTDA
jgi:polyhydroxyalkanoate synthesis regulator phasin